MEQTPATLAQLKEALNKQKDALTKGFSIQTARIYLAKNNGQTPVTDVTSLYDGNSSSGDYPSENFPYVYTEEVELFNYMFSTCINLKEVKYLETGNGTSFFGMFSDCHSLTSIPSIDTSKGTTFTFMFSGCSSLTSIPNLNTSNGVQMNGMFIDCSSLTSIPSIDTSNCNSFVQMFSGCSSLTSIPNLNTSNGIGFFDMFKNCSSLIDIPDLCIKDNGIIVGNKYADMFTGCTSLTTLRDNPYATEGNRWQFDNDVSFGACPLDRTSILKVFNGLATVSGKTITISSTTNGYLSAADKAIAENKGWTVAVV